MLTSLELPALVEVGNELTVSDNELLPTCDPTAMRDYLLSLGWDGSATITNNLAASCSGT